jgi:putative peptide zinc metalloprotease protein
VSGVAAVADERPALRPDVEFVLFAGKSPRPKYLVTTPGAGAVLELEEEAVFVCRHLDGRTTLPELAEQYRDEFGASIGGEELEAFVRQLGHQGLLADAEAPARTFAEIVDPERFLPMGRLRLFRGDRLLAWGGRHLGWLWSRPARALSGLVIAAGLLILLLDGARLLGAIYDHWTLGFLALVVLASTVLVHSPRSIVHGLLCKRHGGQVAEIGVMMMYYVLPWMYCDYRDVARLRDKRAREQVIVGGLYYQVFVWAFATVAWWLTEPGVANTLWLALVVAAGLGFLLFNANPLIKMDAYHLLVTRLEMPRLRERALAAFGAWARRRPLPEPLTRRERRWLIAYGFLTFAYVIGHLALFLALTGRGLARLETGGAVATGLIALFMLQRPIARALMRVPPVRWLAGGDGTGGGMRRWAWRIGILVVLAIVLLLPYPYETGGPFTIIPDVRTEVHCEVEGGRVARVFVREGEMVKAGQPLGQVDPRPYERNVQVTQAELDETEARLRLLRKELALLRNPPNIETIQALEAEARRLRALAVDYRRQLELTTLRAPANGRVTTPRIEQAVGKYLKEGDLFATIEQAQSVQVEISVPEADWPQVKMGARVKIVPWAYPYETFHGTVKDIAPLALSGPPSEGGQSARAVRVIAQIANPDARLKTQLTGYAKIQTDRIPVWLVLTRLVGRWFAVQFWYWLP